MTAIREPAGHVDDQVDIGRRARVRRAIIDKGVRVPSGMSIGFDPAADAARGLTVSPQGVTVVPKGHQFEDAPLTALTR